MSITIHGLKVSDSGSYDCALNLKSHVLNVVHTLQIEGKIHIQINGKIQIQYLQRTFGEWEGGEIKIILLSRLFGVFCFWQIFGIFCVEDFSDPKRLCSKLFVREEEKSNLGGTIFPVTILKQNLAQN